MPRKVRGEGSRKLVKGARQLRREETPSEKRLWAALRGRRLAGLKFRRQHAFERFILDTFCVEHRLAVEVDGDVHADPAQAAYDAERAQYLKEHGIRVLRFSNDEIAADLDGVLKRIVAACVGLEPAPPTPHSRPQSTRAPLR